MVLMSLGSFPASAGWFLAPKVTRNCSIRCRTCPLQSQNTSLLRIRPGDAPPMRCRPRHLTMHRAPYASRLIESRQALRAFIDLQGERRQNLLEVANGVRLRRVSAAFCPLIGLTVGVQGLLESMAE